MTSAAHGYAIGPPIACARLPAGHAAPGIRVETEYFGAEVAAGTGARHLFDPERSRIRRRSAPRARAEPNPHRQDSSQEMDTWPLRTT
ncbi:glycine cleavage T C-terminal barrel domain-containing protein [Streptomyces sp. NPDC020801]|uniref:glycine cleavage T C-terminal barrel domain-containing protein n=1 Tax=unclassified Streptomyces TaxID=2593676 RepID=UPI00379D550D